MALAVPDIYLTAADYRTQTTVPDLVSPLTDEEVEALLLEAMALLDAYVGEGWVPFTDGQEFIFPRCQDEDANGDPFIPRPVSLATRIAADAILEERHKGVLPHQVASEGNLGHSYAKHNRTAQPDLHFDVIPPKAMALLEKFKRAGGCLGVNDAECAVV